VTDRTLQAGEVVLLHDKAGRRYRLVLAAGGSYSTHAGSLAHDALIGQPEGTIATTNLGRRLLALRPTFAEQVVERKRRAQPIYPKDLAAILVHADVSPGDLVVEAGTGTGALTMAALRAVGPGGRVVSYEVRDDFHAAARAAVEEVMGTPPNLELRVGDVYEGIAERGADRVLLDLPEPWRALPHAASPRVLSHKWKTVSPCESIGLPHRHTPISGPGHGKRGARELLRVRRRPHRGSEARLPPQS